MSNLCFINAKTELGFVNEAKTYIVKQLIKNVFIAQNGCETMSFLLLQCLFMAVVCCLGNFYCVYVIF